MEENEILLIVDNNLETVGGEQESVKVILNSLNKKYNFGIAEPGQIPHKIPNVTYYNKTSKNRIKFIARNPFQFLYYFNFLRKLIRSGQPEIIHTQSQVSFFMVALLKKLRLIRSTTKLLHTERGLYISYNLFFKKLFLFLMKELDILVTTTHFNQAYWQKANIKNNTNINYMMIPNTAGELFEKVDEDLFINTTNSFTIGFSGRYSDQKDWPLALKIIKGLNQELGEKLEIKIAMGVLDKRAAVETNQLFTELKELLGERFEGKINNSIEDMNQFYYDIDLFIMTSKLNTESFGRTLVEAMSRKTAVLTTNAGGSEEVVRDKNNICYSLNDFIDKIMDLYYDSDKLNKEKIANLKHVRKTYSLENNIQKHIELYDQLLKEKKRKGVGVGYDITYSSRI